MYSIVILLPCTVATAAARTNKLRTTRRTRASATTMIHGTVEKKLRTFEATIEDLSKNIKTSTSTGGLVIVACSERPASSPLLAARLNILFSYTYTAGGDTTTMIINTKDQSREGSAGRYSSTSTWYHPGYVIHCPIVELTASRDKMKK